MPILLLLWYYPKGNRALLIVDQTETKRTSRLFMVVSIRDIVYFTIVYGGIKQRHSLLHDCLWWYQAETYLTSRLFMVVSSRNRVYFMIIYGSIKQRQSSLYKSNRDRNYSELTPRLYKHYYIYRFQIV
jgi:hypothetical protein